jgi:hypothetical protein
LNEDESGLKDRSGNNMEGRTEKQKKENMKKREKKKQT